MATPAPQKQIGTNGNTNRYAVFSVKDRGEGSKPFWHRIGTAWPLKDGKKGLSVALDSLPSDGRLTILPDEPKQESL